MKLAIITGGFLPVPATKGGAVENLIVNFMNYNEEKHDFDITVFSDYDEKAVDEAKKYNNTNIKFIKSNIFVNILDKIMFFIAKNILKKENSHSYRFIFKRLNYLNEVSKILKKENYDKLLLENHPTEYLALKWRKNYIKYSGKYYYHCHNEFPGTYGCKEIINYTKKFICVSEYISKSLQEYLKFKKEKFCVVRNGINQLKFKEIISADKIKNIKNKYNISEDEKVLIFTGRIVQQKGIKELIEALQKVKYKKYKLIIVGSVLNKIKTKTKYETDVENAVNDVKENVIFTGFINYERIPELYKIADIAVLPSIWDDPAPLTVIESLTCGLPIITTDSGGIPEYANKKCAIILKRDESLIYNLSEAIEKLLVDDNLIESMKKESIKASKELTLDRYCIDLSKELMK